MVNGSADLLNPSPRQRLVAHLELWQVEILHLHLERQLMARRQNSRDLGR